MLRLLALLAGASALVALADSSSDERLKFELFISFHPELAS
jgi:hypothetical protein